MSNMLFSESEPEWLRIAKIKREELQKMLRGEDLEKLTALLFEDRLKFVNWEWLYEIGEEERTMFGSTESIKHRFDTRPWDFYDEWHSGHIEKLIEITWIEHHSEGGRKARIKKSIRVLTEKELQDSEIIKKTFPMAGAPLNYLPSNTIYTGIPSSIVWPCSTYGKRSFYKGMIDRGYFVDRTELDKNGLLNTDKALGAKNRSEERFVYTGSPMNGYSVESELINPLSLEELLMRELKQESNRFLKSARFKKILRHIHDKKFLSLLESIEII